MIKESKYKLRRYYTDLQSSFDQECEKKEVEFSLDFSQCTTNSRIERFLTKQEGWVYKETVIASVGVADKIINGKNIGLLGLVQTAKTAVQSLGGIIGAVSYYLGDGKIAWPLFITPVGKSYDGQFNKKLIDMLVCFKDAIVVNRNGKRIQVGEYLDLLGDFFDKVHEEIRSLRGSVDAKIFNKLKNH